jgi:hypothetical protein
MIVVASLAPSPAMRALGLRARCLLPVALGSVIEREEGDYELDEVTYGCSGTGKEGLGGVRLVFDLEEHMFVG